MATRTAAALTALALALAAAAGEPPGRLVEEAWEVAQVDGVRVGSLHTTVRETAGADGRRLRASTELDLSFRRYNAAARVRMEQATEETPEGRVLGVSMRQLQPGGRELVLTGTVDGGALHLVVDGGRVDRRVRWGGDVVGLAGRDRLLRERRPASGDRFSFLAFEPTVASVVTVRAAVKGREDGPVGGRRHSLLRVELTPDKVVGSNATIQLPTTVLWLDDDFVTQRRQIEIDGLGPVLLTRTTREAAQAGGDPARAADIGAKALVPLNRRITRPHATRSAVYRVTVRGGLDPATAFPSGAHQEVRKVEGDRLELHVHPVRPAAGAGGDPPPAAEYLGTSYYLDADDPAVRALARRAAGTEADPWRQALLLERWVKQNMRPDNAAPFVPASQVARELRGDCRAYALLLAALCRAEGIPARTAVGLVYVDRGAPQLGFHLWTEVWVEGRWLGLDGTLGQGGVGATHIKAGDHSWHDTHSLVPFLPANRILGKVDVDVVRVDTGP
jgi:transglutaminase-like putative cysteine protease